MRRRAYVEASLPFDEAVAVAAQWAGNGATIHVPDTASVEENAWLQDLDLPITCASRRSRFYCRACGDVIAPFLTLPEVLEVERGEGVDSIVVVQAHGPQPYVYDLPSHAPWITAYAAEHLGGEVITSTREAAPPLKAAVKGLTGIAVTNQGLLDKRERSAAVQTLTYLRDRGVQLEPDGLMVEALRNGWGGTGPEELHRIAWDLRRGKKLQYQNRITTNRLQEWYETR
jgi:hypothetical protein